MPRIPSLPDFPASSTVDGADEVALYQASSDRTYGATMDDVVVYVTSTGAIPVRATVSTVSTTTQTPATGTDGRYFRCTNASGCAVTIPDNATQAFPTGTMLTYEQVDTDSAVTFAGDVGVTLNFPAAYQASTAEQFAVVQVCKVATDEWTLYGHLLAV